MIGLAKSVNIGIGCARLRFGRSCKNAATESIVCVRGFFRSAPALNAPPASSPVRMTQRMSGSASSSGSRSRRPLWNSSHQALRASGRLSVRTATAPRRSQNRGMIELLVGVCRASSDPYVVQRGPLAFLFAGVPHAARLDQKQLHFMLGARLVLDALGYDEHLARTYPHRAIAEIDSQIALDHDERLIGIL